MELKECIIEDVNENYITHLAKNFIFKKSINVFILLLVIDMVTACIIILLLPLVRCIELMIQSPQVSNPSQSDFFFLFIKCLSHSSWFIVFTIILLVNSVVYQHSFIFISGSSISSIAGRFWLVQVDLLWHHFIFIQFFAALY